MSFKDGEIEDVLLRLGIETQNVRADEVMALCPGHEYRTGNVDRNPSWSINAETGAHHCFSCGFKGNALTLIAEVLDFKVSENKLDLEAAKSWLRRNTELDVNFISKQLDQVKEMYVYLPKPVPMSEARLAVFSAPPEHALKFRGLTKEACDYYGVVWDNSTESWITPIRYEDGKLMGWQEKGNTERYFRNRPAGISKSKTMFGIEKFSGGTMVVVESPLDAVRLRSVGVEGGVATFGAIVSSDQLTLCRRADRLIFAMDNPRIDDAGKKSMKDIISRCRALGIESYFFNYNRSSAKDVGDMSTREIKYGVDFARHIANGPLALLTLA